jgi:hypothetical protein
MYLLAALLWFGTPLLLALAYLWGSKRLPLALWAGVLGPLNILAIIVIAVPGVEAVSAQNRGADALAAVVAGLAFTVPAALCWLALRWWRADRARSRAAEDPPPLASGPPQGEIAHLHRMQSLRDHARRRAANR